MRICLILFFVNYTDYHRVNGGIFVANRNARAAACCNENHLTDAGAYGSVNCDDEFVGKLVFLDYLNFKKLVSDKLIKLVCGYDVSDYFSF